MKQKILVAMSGGVDSSVAAAILKEEGHEVAGATIRTWASNECADLNTRACCGLSGVEDARDVAESLGIRYWVFNFEKDFKKHVVDYFAAEYLKGRTPNPCIACNEHIKFRLFLKRAQELGFDAIATGHYAQLDQDSQGRPVLTEGADTSKDQSYVLFPLDREVLNRLYLPIGKYTKAEIRAQAANMNLKVAGKPDSQEICFIPSNDYRTFLEREYGTLPHAGANASARQNASQPEAAKRRGVIRTREGKILGEHEGHFRYTRGQRRGLGGGHSERLYVLETLPDTNEVIVGTKEEVFGIRCTVGRMNWFSKPDQNIFQAQVKIRSQHQKAAAEIRVLNENSIAIEFEEAQDAITPGQGAVLYHGNHVLGGGWIDSVKGARETFKT